MEDSPAHRSGQLKVGDFVLEVNDEDATKLSHQELVSRIKSSREYIKLKVQDSDGMNTIVSILIITV